VNSPQNPASAHQHDEMDFSAVLASSVHDMKNSLGMLLNTLSTITHQYPPVDGAQAELFSTLEYEAARINTELIQLLALYRMDEQKLMFVVDEHYLLDIFDEQVARNEALFNSRGIELQVDCPADLQWYCDNEMLGGVLNNLLVNCARYSHKRVRLSARQEQSYLVLAVEDDGSGYPDSMLLDTSTPGAISFSSGSTRLGFVFAHKVMAMHKSREHSGFLRLRNGGSLGGGVAELFLP